MRVLAPERILRLESDRVVLLDQRRLPDEEVELVCRSSADVADAIRTLAVRGAPAIGIAAAYGYALAAERGEDLDAASARLEAARPTAANLAWALREVRAAADPAERARELHAEEVERCRRMSVHAAALIVEGSRALTHCNTGGLATGGQGSALGALHEAWSQGLVRHVFVDETRPAAPGRAADRVGARGRGDPAHGDRRLCGRPHPGERRGRLRARRRGPDRRERRHREQDRHVSACSSLGAARGPVLRRRADLDGRPGDGDRCGDPDRGARSARGERSVPCAQPGVRRHACRADHRDRHGAGRAPPPYAASLPRPVAA